MRRFTPDAEAAVIRPSVSGVIRSVALSVQIVPETAPTTSTKRHNGRVDTVFLAS